MDEVEQNTYTNRMNLLWRKLYAKELIKELTNLNIEMTTDDKFYTDKDFSIAMKHIDERKVVKQWLSDIKHI